MFPVKLVLMTSGTKLAILNFLKLILPLLDSTDPFPLKVKNELLISIFQVSTDNTLSLKSRSTISESILYLSVSPLIDNWADKLLGEPTT